MRWNVEGADPKTGDECVVTVEAATEAQAEAKARASGLLVSNVTPSGVQTAADALDQLVAEETDNHDADPLHALASMQAGPAEYGTSLPRSMSTVPQYQPIIDGAALLKRSAATYQILGVAAFIIGIVVLLVSILAVEQGRANGEAIIIGVLAVLFGAVLAVSLFNMATFIKLLAELSLAVRDMSRNSFRR